MPRQNLIKDWNPDNPEQGFTRANHQYCCDDSITVVNAPDGKTKCLRYILRSTDPTVSGSKRAELHVSTGEAPQESERWYGHRYWFQQYDSGSGAESIFQFHDNNGTTPPLSIQVENGRLRLTQSFTTGNIHTDIGKLEIGKWVDIVLHVKWSTTNTGLIELWKDGVKVISKSNIKTNAVKSNYAKYGINKWSWAPGAAQASVKTARIFYIDQVRQASEKGTYQDVAPETDGVVIPIPNKAPLVNAGPDQVIKLPTDTIELNGLVSDPDGTIASVLWSQISGPGSTIANQRLAATSVKVILPGVHVFMLEAKDNNGASSVDQVQVTVLEADVIPEPTSPVIKQVQVVYSDGTTKTVD